MKTFFFRIPIPTNTHTHTSFKRASNTQNPAYPRVIRVRVPMCVGWRCADAPMKLLTTCCVLLRGASAASSSFNCTAFNCTCQGFADYFGTIACIPKPPNGRKCGFGCAPPDSFHWWSVTKNCVARTAGTYCGGAGCKLAGAKCVPTRATAPGGIIIMRS